jgi:hypothetical protein
MVREKVIHKIKKLNKKNFLSRQTRFDKTSNKVSNEANLTSSHIEKHLVNSGISGLCHILNSSFIKY